MAAYLDWQLESALLSLVPGQVSEWRGVLIHRASERTWSVNRSEPAMLLPAVDALARCAGWRADGRVRPAHR